MGSPFLSTTSENQLRPPTPPRRTSLSDAPTAVTTIESQPTLRTPTSTPIRSPDAQANKTVKWSPWTTYHPPHTDSENPSPTRIPSGGKPLKSILKPFRQDSTPTSSCHALGQAACSSPQATLSSMLGSVIDALTGRDRGSKLDHYIMFSNSLRAYPSIPDLEEFALRIPVLVGLIKRDLEATMDDGNCPDSPIIQQAIKLLNIILWTPKLIASVDDRSIAWFLQHAIQRIEDPATSKYTINLYLHLLANNKVHPRLITAERSARLIGTLSTLDLRVQGKAIAKERIDIFIKLLHDAKLTMQAKVAQWMPIVFRGLLSNVKEVRHRSLACMNETARILGGDKNVARCVTTIFGDKSSGRRMYEEIRQRLEVLARTEHDGIFVARTWAAVLMVVQGRDHWEFFNPWLRIIEYCFNISERDVKVEAQMAWSKLICLADVGNNTDRKLLHLLRKPLEQYLDPRYHLSNTLKPRKAAILNVIILLYYGLRPNVSFKHLSDIWEVVVVGLVQNLMLASQDEASDGCLILEGIFNGPSASTPWADHRVLNGPALTPDDLPRLEPRWVRANCAQILRTVEAALKVSHWEDRSKGSGFAVWTAFVQSIADAGKKEIKVSPELMEAVSDLLNFFQRIWKDGLSIGHTTPNRPPVGTMEVFCFLVESTIETLGPFCFVERQISFNDSSTFSPISTPRKPITMNDNTPRIPPVGHIFQMLLEPRSDVMGADYFDRVREVISKLVNSQDSRRKRLGILASFVRLMPEKTINDIVLRVWDILAMISMNSITTTPRDVTFAGGLPIANDLTDAQLLLDWAVNQPVAEWGSLFTCLADTMRREYGNQEVVVRAIAPVLDSDGFLSTPPDVAIGRLIALLDALSAVNSDSDSDSSKRSANPTQDKIDFIGICRRVLDRCGSLLKAAYQCSNNDATTHIALCLLVGLGKFLEICTYKDVEMLAGIYEGLEHWISDDTRKLSDEDDSQVSILTAIWKYFLRINTGPPPYNSGSLTSQSSRLMIGFESRFRAVKLITVEFWNSTFGLQSELEYPPALIPCLLEIRATHHIALPSFPIQGKVRPKVFPAPVSSFASAPNLTPLNTSDLSSRSPSPTSRVNTRRPSAPAALTNPSPMAKESPSGLRRKSAKIVRKRLASTKTKQHHNLPDRSSNNDVTSSREPADIEFSPLHVGPLSDAFRLDPPGSQKSRNPQDVRSDVTSRPFSRASLTKSGRGSPVSPISLDSDNESHISAPVETPVKPRSRTVYHQKPLLAAPRYTSKNRDESPSHLSVDDMFVDAPESIDRKTPETFSPLLFDGEISPLKDVAELAREIPIRSPDRFGEGIDVKLTQHATQPEDFPMSSPEAQIIAEVALAMPNSSSKKRTPRLRKRKRISEPSSPSVSDTIVVNPAINSSNNSSEIGTQSQVLRNSEAPQGPPSRKRRTKRTDEPSATPSRPARPSDISSKGQSSATECRSNNATLPGNTLAIGSPSPKKALGSEDGALQIISNVPQPSLVPADHRIAYPVAGTQEMSLVACNSDGSASTVAKAKESIKSILDMVEVSGMSLSETAALEDEMFEAFSKLRKKRQQMGSR